MPGRGSSRLTAVLATFAIGLAGALVAPTAAHADDVCDGEDNTFPVIDSYSPTSVAVGLRPRLVTFSVSASDNCGIEDWLISGEGIFAFKSDPTDQVYGWTNSDAGTGYLDIEVNDTSYNTTTERHAFALLRQTRLIGVNVTPEPVKKGHYVTVRGKLERADWDRDKYVGYGARSQRVAIQFKPAGAASYLTIRTVKLGKKSKLKKRIRVSGITALDGTYRLSYAGNSTSSASVSIGDFVDVK